MPSQKPAERHLRLQLDTENRRRIQAETTTATYCMAHVDLAPRSPMGGGLQPQSDFDSVNQESGNGIRLH